jgi:hypothetical protein
MDDQMFNTMIQEVEYLLEAAEEAWELGDLDGYYSYTAEANEINARIDAMIRKEQEG